MASTPENNLERELSPRILVTGADGQLGRELADIFQPDEAVFANRSKLDITDADAVNAFISHGGFTHIVNCAAYTAVDSAEDHPEECHKVNVAGVANIVNAIKEKDIQLIHISTDFVFDGKKVAPYTETDSTMPLSVYGLTKLDSEKIVTENRPDAVILRTGWLYSSYGHNFVKTILRNARDGKTLKVVDDQTGTPTYAADLARIIATIVRQRAFPGGIYHYSSDGQTNWFEFAVTILASAFPDFHNISPVTSGTFGAKAQRPTYSVLDKSKITGVLKTDIPHWQTALAQCLAKIDINTL